MKKEKKRNLCPVLFLLSNTSFSHVVQMSHSYRSRSLRFAIIILLKAFNVHIRVFLTGSPKVAALMCKTTKRERGKKSSKFTIFYLSVNSWAMEAAKLRFI